MHLLLQHFIDSLPILGAVDSAVNNMNKILALVELAFSMGKINI